MRSFLINPALSISGNIYLPSDKSISHRAIIISAISKGKTILQVSSLGQDCGYTIQAFKKLGVKIIRSGSRVVVYGKGLRGFTKARSEIFVGDSGTTIRLLSGLLSGQHFSTTLIAGRSLSRRPMKRITKPLRMMGATINSKSKIPASPAGRQNPKMEEYPPLTIRGGDLKAMTYKLPVASAQVKSAILLAGLYAKGKTKVIEPVKTRDHTERMLKLFHADLRVNGKTISLNGAKRLKNRPLLNIPGDISSAAFFIVAALILENSRLVIKSVGLNPGRLGLIKVLRRMGADIKIKNQKSLPAGEAGKIKNYEPVGDLTVRSSRLKATTIKKREIPSLIDELPILMVAACFARGQTIIESAQELRLKETDRIKSMILGLSKMKARIRSRSGQNQEDLLITGIGQLKGARVMSFGDHRTAMSLVIAGLRAKGATIIDDITCINKSFPGFTKTLKMITG